MNMSYLNPCRYDSVKTFPNKGMNKVRFLPFLRKFTNTKYEIPVAQFTSSARFLNKYLL